MSISSSLAADWFNEIKTGWAERLAAALSAHDWPEVAAVLDEMRRFTASE